MKKYVKEIVILLMQLLIFYTIPLFAGPTDAMGMVVLMILFTFVLSVVIGVLSKQRVVYLYPIATVIMFVPSVYIFYNESALVHAIWYFVVSVIGIAIGIIIRKLIVNNLK